MGTLAASAQESEPLVLSVSDNESASISAWCDINDEEKEMYALEGTCEKRKVADIFISYNATLNVASDLTLVFSDETNYIVLLNGAVINLYGKMAGEFAPTMTFYRDSKLNLYLDYGAEFTVILGGYVLNFEFQDGYDNHFQYIFSLPAEGGWRSLYLPTQAKVPAGCTAYWASSASGSTVTLKAINEGEVIPAHEGVILYGAGDITMEGCYTEEPVTITGNLFKGVSTVTACSANENYVLNASTSTAADVVKFSNYTGTSLGANKAYLPKSAVGGASSIQFRFDDATAISTVEMESSDDALYNMAGQRVSSDYRGIVIKNGKKMWNN